MSWELNRATFRRLVQFHIASFIALIAACSLQFVIPSWDGFSDRFDELVADHFGRSEPGETMLLIALGLAIALLVWMIASMIGLLWFKRWARFGTWASVPICFVLIGVVFGTEPSFSTPLDDALATIDSALLGAIILMAYAKGMGADWFAPGMASED